MIGAAIRKDVLVLARDRGAVLGLFALPVIFMLTFGSAFSSPTAHDDARGGAIAGMLGGASSLQIAVPGNAVLFGFFIALTTAMAFAGERRGGTWRRLLAAPVPRWKALLATLVPYYLVGVLQLAFLFGVGLLVFGVTIAGSVAALVALSLALVFCAVALFRFER